MEGGFKYEFSNEDKKVLGPEQKTELVKMFKTYDKNGDGTM